MSIGDSCDHERLDFLDNMPGYSSVIPRCLDCGDIYKYELSQWICVPMWVAALFASGHDEVARSYMNYMDCAIKEGLPYPQNSEEQYRKIADILKRNAMKS